jgi:hypothetical protein
MSDEFPRRRNLDSLKKEAKRWLAALRENAGEARARLARALPAAPETPTLRDVQLALAREHGFPGWAALKRGLTPDPSARARTLVAYEAMADALLEELMPMDIRDEGYRHVGRCEGLESLILKYCRNTTVAATAHLTRLRLSYYFNSYTTITDRTPELLSGMETLERVTFDACHGLTDAGIAKLARLPSLKELRVSGNRVTPGVRAMFASSVAVNREP